MKNKKFKMADYNLEDISRRTLDHIGEILDYFEIEHIDHGHYITFACPIHEGDNEVGSSIQKKGIGNWKCFTNQCHEQYGNSGGASILQFIQALLTRHHSKKCSFFEAVNWAIKFTGGNMITVMTPEEKSTTSFIQLCRYLNRKKDRAPIFTPRENVKNFLKIPAEYYIRRGYSEDILSKFDIGYCFNENKSFFDRVITPFYDDFGEYMIGCSGRNKYEKCNRCNMYHNPITRCPITKEEKVRASKWKHSSDFSIDSYLYNYWNAKKHIANSYTVVLVEGPGDVWRLEEAGIHNCLGLLGARLSGNQQVILEQSGAINILIATDNDDAGNNAAKSIVQNCRNIFNIKRIKYHTKDPGSLSIEETKQIFLPVLERM